MTRILVRLAIIILGTASILLVGSLFWFGLSPQRDPAQFPTQTTALAPDLSALDQATPLPGYEALADLVAATPSDGPYVVNFFASWCQPCHALATDANFAHLVLAALLARASSADVLATAFCFLASAS